MRESGEIPISVPFARKVKFYSICTRASLKGSMKTKITVAGQDLEYPGTDQYGSWYNFLNPEILTTIVVRPDVSLWDTVLKTVDTFRLAQPKD
jgi:hypothetical protein